MQVAKADGASNDVAKALFAVHPDAAREKESHAFLSLYDAVAREAS